MVDASSKTHKGNAARFERLKRAIKKNPLLTLQMAIDRFGVSCKTVRKAWAALLAEGFNAETVAREKVQVYFRDNPNATATEAAAFFDTSNRNIARFRDGINYRAITDDALFSRRVMRPAAYVCDVLKRGYTGVSLPPEEFSRYLDLYNRKKGGF